MFFDSRCRDKKNQIDSVDHERVVDVSPRLFWNNGANRVLLSFKNSVYQLLVLYVCYSTVVRYRQAFT